MKKLVHLLFLFWSVISVCGQKNDKPMVGEYYLRGVMETASGFKLNADASFQFFYSYGALDRHGSGKWAIKGDKVIFNSRETRASSFVLLNSKKINNDSISIKIIEKNPSLLKRVYCSIKSGSKVLNSVTDANGVASFSKMPVDSIGLVFEFCLDRPAAFTPNKEHNYFEFRFDPSIWEVYFENFELKIGNNEFTGPHPLLDGNKFRYVKD
jgi:hypothetical protein